MRIEREVLINLVTRAQAGDPKATNCLFEEFSNDIFAHAMKEVKNKQAAEDITQDVMIELFRYLPKLKEPAAFIKVMRMSTSHRISRYFKSRGKEDILLEENEDSISELDLLEEDNAEFIPHEALEREDLKNIIISLMDGLSYEQRSALQMMYYDDMPIKDIAEVQGVSEGTVKSRLNYAKKTMKGAIEDYEKKHGLRLHSLAFLPIFRLAMRSDIMANGLSASQSATIAGNITAATGTVIGKKPTFFDHFKKLPGINRAVATVTATAVAAGSVAGGIAAGVTIAENVKVEETTYYEETEAETEPEEEEEYSIGYIIPEGGEIDEGIVLGVTVGDGKTTYFPEELSTGLGFTYGDYKYTYSDTFIMEGLTSGITHAMHGWIVDGVTDKSKTEYAPIPSSIAGMPVMALENTFDGCTNMVRSPEIPESVLYLLNTYKGCSVLEEAPVLPENAVCVSGAFQDCRSLTTAPIIGEHVNCMRSTFYGCDALTGDIVINSKRILNGEYCFIGTEKPITIVGSCPAEELENLMDERVTNVTY